MTVTDASQQTSQTALSMNIDHAQVVANTVRSTLGPKGLDKMLTDAGVVLRLPMTVLLYFAM